MTNQEGKKLLGLSRYLGHKTNNEAEYWALLIGLREAQRWGGGSIHIFTDSKQPWVVLPPGTPAVALRVASQMPGSTQAAPARW